MGRGACGSRPPGGLDLDRGELMQPKYPPPTPGVFRITNTELNILLKCSLMWQLREDRKSRRITVNMAIGSAVAAGAKLDNLTKMAEGTPARMSDLVDSGVEAYKLEVEESEVQESHLEQIKGLSIIPQYMRLYGSRISPRVIEVLAVEEPIVSAVGEIEIAGTPDVISTSGIGDLKTGKPWDQDRAHNSRQLTIYDILHIARFGKPSKLQWIDSLHSTGHDRYYTVRTAEDHRRIYNVLLNAKRLKESGIALPAPEGSWYCSRKYCPYWDVCPVMGGKQKG